MMCNWKKQTLLLGALLLVLSCSETCTREEIEKLFKPITSKYGVRIVYEIDEDFAPLLIGGVRARFVTIEKVNPCVLARYPILLTSALGKYPVKMIKEHLAAFYYVNAMEDHGFRYAAAYDASRRIIYLADNGSKSDDDVIYAFHHEFSSLLINRHGFFITPWLEQNPREFKYFSEIIKEWDRVKTSGEGTQSDYAQGFLTDYGKTTFENDFNEFSAMIFTYPHEFKKIMDQYPRVRAKFLLWLEFYHKVDPIFTEEYLLGTGAMP